MNQFDVSKVDLDRLAEAAMAGNMDDLDAIVAGQEEAAVPKDEGAEQEVTPATSGGETETKEPETSEEHATGVSTKDGKGVIPYTVLKETRAKASTLQQENEWLKEQLEQLTQGTPAPAKQEEVPASVDDMDAKIQNLRTRAAAMADDFPELADVLTQNADLLAETRKQMLAIAGAYQSDRDAQQQDEQKTISATVQEAIDQIPALAAWQSAQGAEWELALEQDRILRQRPEWADKTFDERFAKVTELVGVLMPGSVPKVDPPPVPSKSPSSEQPGARKAPVNSLSDIPGGVLEGRTPVEQVDGMSAAALGNKMLSMTPDQLQDYLSTLGV